MALKMSQFDARNLWHLNIFLGIIEYITPKNPKLHSKRRLQSINVRMLASVIISPLANRKFLLCIYYCQSVLG